MILENNSPKDTIVAIATAFGIGSISIIRLSGKQSYQIAQKLTKNIKLKTRYAHLSKIYDYQNDFIDEAIIIYFKAPFSFTGEDIVEIQCHGGVTLSKMILNTCLKMGARLAEAGEFSKKAFLNNKMDMSKIESISSLINAKSENIAKIVAGNLKGDLSKFVGDLREQLIEILAYSEVSIDYAQEDLPDDLIQNMAEKLQHINKNIIKIIQSNKQRINTQDGHKVVLVGSTNAGKSSLLNLLLQYERAIVSDIEGTTRDTIEESIMISTSPIRLIDTAGIRNSTDKIENIGINKSIEYIKNADVVVALFDNSKELGDNDKQVLNLLDAYCQNKKENTIKVLTKSDLPNKNNLTQTIKISCKNNDIKQLTDKLISIIENDNTYCEVVLTSIRQVDIFKDVSSSIEKSYEFLHKEELELFSFHINESLMELSKITKGFEHSELLDKIFSSFCLGK